MKPVDAAHIKSKGAGGPDEEWNLLPLCRGNHRLQHRRGWKDFVEEHPPILEALLERGWDMTEYNGRFILSNERLHEKE